MFIFVLSLCNCLIALSKLLACCQVHCPYSSAELFLLLNQEEMMIAFRRDFAEHVFHILKAIQENYSICEDDGHIKQYRICHNTQELLDC